MLSATGLGPMPGVDPVETARAIAGELPDLPHLAELPARGVGADPLGRAVGLLVDLYAEVVPSGWRVSRRPSREVARAKDFLSWDLDALEEQYAGAGRVKVQICGPWTLAAGTELWHGNRALTDDGAVDDLVSSLSEGVREHLAQVRRRLPGALVTLQVDEGGLPDVMAGNLPTASGFGTVRQVGRHRVDEVLRRFLDGLGELPLIAAGADPSTAPILIAAGFTGLAIDFTNLGGRTSTLDFLGEGLESGLTFLAGTIPVHSPDDRESTDPDPDEDRAARRGTARRGLAEWAKPIAEPLQKLGIRPQDVAGQLVITPAGSLADSDPDWARRALTLSRDVARHLSDPR